MSKRADPEDIGEAVGTFVAAAIVSAIFVTLMIILMEAIRIYRAHGWSGSERSRQILWVSLLGFSALLGCSVLLLSSPATASWSAWPASLGFLAWVISIELVDLVGEQSTAEQGQVETVDDVLGPWKLHQTLSTGKPEPAARPADEPENSKVLAGIY